MKRKGLLLATLVALAASAPARRAGASWLGEACRASELVIEARVVAGPDEFGLCTLEPGRAVARPGGSLPATLLARLPPRAARTGSSWLLFLVRDDMARSLDAWAPVDPDLGAVPLDGSAGPADALLAAADLAASLPADPSALAQRLSSLVGRGDAPTAFALEELLERPELLSRSGAHVGPPLRAVLQGRRVSPPTAALAVRALAHVGAKGDDSRLVDLVAAEAPETVVDAVVDVLPALAGPATAGHLEHALGGATPAAVPGLLRLAGPCSARSLLPLLHERLASSRREQRIAAISSLAILRDPSSSEALLRCAAHPDAETAQAARAALAALQAGGQ